MFSCCCPAQAKDESKDSAGTVKVDDQVVSTSIPSTTDPTRLDPSAGSSDKYARRKSVSSEKYDPAEDAEEGDEPNVINPKSDEQRKRLAQAVKNILLFKHLDLEQMNVVLDAMFERRVEPGEHIIDQGDDGDNFYVIDSGRYDAFVKTNGVEKKVFEYEDHGFFGELALMYNQPRAATVIATTDGIIWALDRNTFRRIVLKSAYQRRQRYLDFMEFVTILKPLSEYEKMNIADALQSKTFGDGDRIIKQGDSADCMYFVEEGEVRITFLKESTNSEIELTRLGKGAYFGELALLTKKPRAANVYAVGSTRCAVLDAQAFDSLLDPCMEAMKQNIPRYKEQMKKLVR